MVRTTNCTTRDLGYSNVLSIPLPNDDIVDKVPVLRAGVHPCRPVTSRETEHCIGNQKFVFSTELKEEKAVAVTCTSAVLTEDVLPGLVIHTDSGIEVAENNQLFTFGTAVTREISSS